MGLSGDDQLLCFLMNMNTRRWIRLGSNWSTRFSALVGSLNGAACWLNLLCCTLQPKADVPRGIVDPDLRIDDWALLLR